MKDNQCNDKITASKATACTTESHYTADGKVPNAVLVKADDAGAELIFIEDFDDSESLGAPLDCSRVDRVMNRLPGWGKSNFGLNLVGYVDPNGIPKGLEENPVIQRISGYDYIAGDCVIVRMDDRYNYLPLSAADAVKLWKYFDS